MSTKTNRQQEFEDWAADLEKRAPKTEQPPTASSEAQPVVQKKPSGNSLKVYLAGRISKNDWRHKLVRFEEYSPEDWRKVVSRTMFDGNTYVGPFFVDCDHGCFHGKNSHGAGAGHDSEIGITCIDEYCTQPEVFNKALDGIKACDVFFVWAGTDFNQAYGTLVEIGLARALGKKIIIARHPDVSRGSLDQWFAMACASEIHVADNPVDAYERAIGRARVLEPLNVCLLCGGMNPTIHTRVLGVYHLVYGACRDCHKAPSFRDALSKARGAASAERLKILVSPR